MSLGRRLLHSLNGLLPSREDGLVVLTYHLVDGGTRSPVDLSAEVFAQQIAQLRDRVVSLDDGIKHLATAGRGTRVVLTFDDAFENFHTVAWPILVKAQVPSTLYVPTDFVDRLAPAPLRGGELLPACSWDHLRDMAATGLLTIGSHTRSHRDLSRLGVDDVRRELVSSKRRLEDELGGPVISFCYPGGRVSHLAASMVRDVYSTAVVRGGRKNHATTWSPWALERVPLRIDSPRSMERILDGPVWLEERLATGLGRLRDRWRSRTAGIVAGNANGARNGGA